MHATGTPLPVPRADQEDLLIRVRAAASAATAASSNAESQLQSAKAIALVARTDLIEERNAGADRLTSSYEAEPAPLSSPLGQRGPEVPAVDVGGVLLLLSVLGAVLSNQWVVTSRFARLTQLVVHNAPKGAKIVLRCKGRGCPSRKATRRTVSRALQRVTLHRAFRRAKLRFGTKLTLSITAAQTIGRTYTYVVKRGEIPTRTTDPSTANPSTAA